MTTMTLTPAYGRDYQSQDAVLRDWHDGRDFVINCVSGPMRRWSGSYTSCRDKQAMIDGGYTSICFRFGKHERLHMLDLSGEVNDAVAAAGNGQ